MVTSQSSRMSVQSSCDSNGSMTLTQRDCSTGARLTFLPYYARRCSLRRLAIPLRWSSCPLRLALSSPAGGSDQATSDGSPGTGICDARVGITQPYADIAADGGDQR